MRNRIIVAFSFKPGKWEKNPDSVMSWEKAVDLHNSGFGTLITRKYDRRHKREKYQLEYQHYSDPQRAPWAKLRAGDA